MVFPLSQKGQWVQIYNFYKNNITLLRNFELLLINQPSLFLLPPPHSPSFIKKYFLFQLDTRTNTDVTSHYQDTQYNFYNNTNVYTYANI